MGALPFAIELLSSLPGLIAAGVQVTGLLTQSNATLKKLQDENRDPTPAEWDALNKTIADLRKQLHAP